MLAHCLLGAGLGGLLGGVQPGEQTLFEERNQALDHEMFQGPGVRGDADQLVEALPIVQPLHQRPLEEPPFGADLLRRHGAPGGHIGERGLLDTEQRSRLRQREDVLASRICSMFACCLGHLGLS